MYKRILTVILILSLALSCFMATGAADDGIKVMVNGKSLSFDVPPMLISDRTMVPLRAIFEALQAEVDWNGDTQTITALKDGNTIILIIDNKTATVNGKAVQLDAPPTVINDRTLVPVRFISESLGADVEWIDATQTVVITLVQTPIQTQGEKIVFTDKDFERAVRDYAGKPEGDIFSGDVTELDLSGGGLVDISDISQFTQLTSLDLSDNEIKSADALGGLTRLTELNVGNNFISNISCLSGLTGLETLYIYSNPIESIEVITGMNELARLYLYEPTRYVVAFDTRETSDSYAKAAVKAKEIISKIITPNMSELEKEIYLHDYLAVNVEYDFDVLINPDDETDSHNINSVFYDKIGVCDAYSHAFAMLLNFAGIKCITVIGVTRNLSGQSGGHAWNIVRIDGRYYHTDVTNAKSASFNYEADRISHKMFNVSTEQIWLFHYYDAKSYPVCDTENPEFMNMCNMLNVYENSEFFFILHDGKIYMIFKNVDIAALPIKSNVLFFALYNDEIFYIDAKTNEVYVLSVDLKNDVRLGSIKANEIAATPQGIYFTAVDNTTFYFTDFKSLGGGKISDKGPKIKFSEANCVILKRADLLTIMFPAKDGIVLKSGSFGKPLSLDIFGTETKSKATYPNCAGFKETREYGSDMVYIRLITLPLEFIRGDSLYYIHETNGYIIKADLNKKAYDTVLKSEVLDFSYDLCGDYLTYQKAGSKKFYIRNLETNAEKCLSD